MPCRPAAALVLAPALVGMLSAAACGSSPPAGGGERVVFFDDFDGDHLDADKWFVGLTQHGGDNNNGVVPENLSVHPVDDNGTRIGVLDAQANGDLYQGPVRGVRRVDNAYPLGDPRGYRRQDTGARTGGLVWTNQRFGAGRYEVRMKALPRPGGCSCMWNYYDPADPVLPQPATGGSYTEIDIELPSNGHAGGDWSRWIGFNAFTAPDDAHAGYHDVDAGEQHDGQFHVYHWDWYDGTNGSKRVDFYLDGTPRATEIKFVPTSPAQLWVGTWPAPWSGAFDYDTQHLYIDWVKITSL